MRILTVSATMPYLPSHDSLRTQAAHLLEGLASRHTVTLIAAAAPGETPAQRRWAESRCALVERVPVPSWPSGTPAMALERLRAATERAIARIAPEVLLLDGTALAPLARIGGLPTVLALRDSPQRRRRPEPTPWAWLSARLAERRDGARDRRGLSVADVRVVGSAEEQAALAALGAAGRHEVIPAGVDPGRYEFRRAGTPGRIALGVDLASPADVQMARHFAGTVFPKVRARCPGAELVLVGADASRAARTLGPLRGVRPTGTVSDVRPSFWGTAVMVRPFRVGFGAPSRVVEAMALGTPTVASSRGLAGLDGVVPGEHLLTAADDDEMADGVVLLLRDAATADTLARNARALVERAWSWPAVARRWERLLASVATAPAARATA